MGNTVSPGRTHNHTRNRIAMATRLLLHLTLASCVLGRAFLAPRHVPSNCESYGECEWISIGGYRVPRLVAPYNHNTSSLPPPLLSIRQTTPDPSTNVDIGSATISDTTATHQDSAPADPTAFTNLWNRVAEACLQSTCDPSQTLTEGDFQLVVEGQFPGPNERGQFIELLKEAFFRSLKKEEFEQRYVTPSFVVGLPGTPVFGRYKRWDGVGFLNANK